MPADTATESNARLSFECLLVDAEVRRDAEYAADQRELHDIVERAARGDEPQPSDGQRALILIASIPGETREHVTDLVKRRREQVRAERLLAATLQKLQEAQELATAAESRLAAVNADLEAGAGAAELLRWKELAVVLAILANIDPNYRAPFGCEPLRDLLVTRNYFAPVPGWFKKRGDGGRDRLAKDVFAEAVMNQIAAVRERVVAGLRAQAFAICTAGKSPDEAREAAAVGGTNA